MSWDDLSQGHRLSIIGALMEIWHTPDVAALPNLLRSIGLDSRQVRRDCIDLVQCSIEERIEAERIDDLQSCVSNNLLQGGNRDSPGLSEAAFRELVKKHLYKDLTKSSQYVSTKKELDTARRFAINLGLDPRILGEWVDMGHFFRPQGNRVDSYECPAQTGSGLHTDSPQWQTADQAAGFNPSSPSIATPSTHSRPMTTLFQLRSNEHSALAARRESKRSQKEGLSAVTPTVPPPVHQRLVLSQPRVPDDVSRSENQSPPLRRNPARKPLRIRIVNPPPVAVAQGPVRRQVSEAAAAHASGLPTDESKAENETGLEVARQGKVPETPIKTSGQRLGCSLPVPLSTLQMSESASRFGTPSSPQSTPVKKKRGPRGPYNTRRRREEQLRQAMQAAEGRNSPGTSKQTASPAHELLGVNSGETSGTLKKATKRNRSTSRASSGNELTPMAIPPQELEAAITATAGSLDDQTDLVAETTNTAKTPKVPKLIFRKSPAPANSGSRKKGVESEGSSTPKRSKISKSLTIGAEQDVATERAASGGVSGEDSSSEVAVKKTTRKGGGRKAKGKKVA